MDTTRKIHHVKKNTSIQEEVHDKQGSINISELTISPNEIAGLEERAKTIVRASKYNKPLFSRKMCPTRHGCKGATNCDYSYASYPG